MWISSTRETSWRYFERKVCPVVGSGSLTGVSIHARALVIEIASHDLCFVNAAESSNVIARMMHGLRCVSAIEYSGSASSGRRISNPPARMV